MTVRGLVAVALGIGAVPTGAQVIEGPITFGSSNYYLIAPMDFLDAESFAQGLGGHLVTINDEAEQLWVSGRFPGIHWIGLNALSGGWAWTSGSGSGFFNWGCGQPGCCGFNENTAVITHWGDCGISPLGGDWHDVGPGPQFSGIVEVPAGPITITSLDRTTFIATDTITLEATVIGAPPGANVLWTVTGMSGASGVTGFPTDQMQPVNGNGVSTFSFRPADNPNFVEHRRTVWTTGSRVANPAIGFRVRARIVINGQNYQHFLSQTRFWPFQQDEVDRLRQEYWDYNIAVPSRAQVVPSLGALNWGNYAGVQLDQGLQAKLDSIVAAYRGRTVLYQFEDNGSVYLGQTVIPPTAEVMVSSAYRNPQRNRAAGSIVVDSDHTRGRAIDLVPVVFQVRIETTPGVERTFPISLHAALYPALHDAASIQPDVDSVICECSEFKSGPIVFVCVPGVPNCRDPIARLCGQGDGSCGDANILHVNCRGTRRCVGENHVHVEW